MKTKLLLCMLGLLLLASCEKAEMPGISEEKLSQEQIIGGWGTTNVKCYISHSNIPGTDALENQMKKRLEERVYPSSFYITKDSIYFIRTHEEGYNYVRCASAYHLEYEPTRIFMDNSYFLNDQYAPFFYLKSENGMLCLYLTKDETLALIEKDGSFDGFMGLVKKIVDDAQFEFYLKRNELDIYKDIDNGFFPHSDY